MPSSAVDAILGCHEHSYPAETGKGRDERGNRLKELRKLVGKKQQDRKRREKPRYVECGAGILRKKSISGEGKYGRQGLRNVRYSVLARF